jgi:hypothetical protein
VKKELPPGLVAAVAVAVIVVLGLVGWSFMKPKTGVLPEDEQKKAQQTMMDQYKQFGPKGSGMR